MWNENREPKRKVVRYHTSGDVIKGILPEGGELEVQHGIVYYDSQGNPQIHPTPGDTIIGREVDYVHSPEGIKVVETDYSPDAYKPDGDTRYPQCVDIDGKSWRVEEVLVKHLRSQRYLLERESSSEDKPPSLCYLTTACVDAMGLPDDCLELGTLRWFRDRVLLPTKEGKRAVRQYYDEAPEIVQAVNRDAEAGGVWKSVYRDVATAVRMVLSGDYQGAFSHYREMAQRLRSDFV